MYGVNSTRLYFHHVWLPRSSRSYPLFQVRVWPLILLILARSRPTFRGMSERRRVPPSWTECSLGWRGSRDGSGGRPKWGRRRRYTALSHRSLRKRLADFTSKHFGAFVAARNCSRTALSDYTTWSMACCLPKLVYKQVHIRATFS